jgi:hypothetical protein
MNKQWLVLLAAICAMLLFPIAASAADVTLIWDANTETDLAGYKLYYGTASRAYAESVDVGNVTQHMLNDMAEGQKVYFAVTAYDVWRNETGYSNEVTAMYQNGIWLQPDSEAPLVPQMFRILEQIASSLMGVDESLKVLVQK